MSFWNPKQWSKATREKDFAAIADWFITYFIVSGVAIILFAGLAAGLDIGPANGFRVFVIGGAVSAAFAVAGWLLGLLFGIPRSLSRGLVGGNSATDDARSARSSRVNTNLEDISDWLTKTLVGVGLTSIFSAPHFLWRFADLINRQGFGWSPYGRSLALMLILFFSSGGFWLGYVGTRTILTKLLDSFEAESDTGAALLSAKISTLLQYLYDQSRNNYDAAIHFGKELLTDPEAKATNEALIWFALACAYGQKHAVNKREHATPEVLAELRLEALKAARAAVARDPSQKRQLYILWQTKEDEVESDLASIDHNDPDFIQLLQD